MVFMTELLTGTAATAAFAKKFLGMLIPSKDGATIVGLSGDLGSGKTTFVKYLAESLGIKDEILSPTFVLAKYYDIPRSAWKKMVHIDAYRIDDPGEIKVLKWENMITVKDQLVVVEWPERIGAQFPDTAVVIRFEFVNEQTRNVTIV